MLMDVRCRVVRVVHFESQTPHLCRFESYQGLWSKLSSSYSGARSCLTGRLRSPSTIKKLENRYMTCDLKPSKTSKRFTCVRHRQRSDIDGIDIADLTVTIASHSNFSHPILHKAWMYASHFLK